MSPLLSFIAKRVLQAIPLIFVTIIITFILVHAAPGDPTYILTGEIGDEEFVKMLRAKFGLDRPLHEQFVIYLWNVLRGDLGYSYIKGASVSKLILERIPATMILVITGMTLAVIIGIPIGIILAIRRDVIGTLLSFLSLLGVSTPYFWLGQMLLIIFALILGLFPVGGMIDVKAGHQGLDYFLDLLHHLTLPAVTLAIFNIAYIARITRASLIEALNQNYIVTARAKGLSERTVLLKHALRNALLPVTTYTGLTIGVLLVGAILTETIYSWPGMGLLLYEALRLRDYPVVLGVFIYGSIIVIVANLIVDILYAILDPRIRIR